MTVQYKFPEDFGGEVQHRQHKLKERQRRWERKNIWDYWYEQELNRF